MIQTTITRNHPPTVTLVAGAPICPDHFDADQRALWDSVVEMHPSGQLGAVDTPLLIELVETYTLLVRIRVDFAKYPYDRDVRLAYSATFQNFKVLAEMFSLNVRGRPKAGLQGDPTGADALKRDGLAAFPELVSRLGGKLS